MGPLSTTLPPYITYQGLGGTPQRYADNTAADKRHTLLQIDAWAAMRVESLSLIRQVEGLICNVGAMPFMAQPESEPTGLHEDDTLPPLFGCMQDFSIISTR